MSDPLRVLIVDDEAPARNRLRDLLSDCKETLSLTLAGEAGNGVQALEWLNQQPADVVLLDIRMPGMSGIDLLAAMVDLFPDVVRVIVSAYSDAERVKVFLVKAPIPRGTSGQVAQASIVEESIPKKFKPANAIVSLDDISGREFSDAVYSILSTFDRGNGPV